VCYEFFQVQCLFGENVDLLKGMLNIFSFWMKFGCVLGLDKVFWLWIVHIPTQGLVTSGVFSGIRGYQEKVYKQPIQALSKQPCLEGGNPTIKLEMVRFTTYHFRNQLVQRKQHKVMDSTRIDHFHWIVPMMGILSFHSY